MRVVFKGLVFNPRKKKNKYLKSLFKSLSMTQHVIYQKTNSDKFMEKKILILFQIFHLFIRNYTLCFPISSNLISKIANYPRLKYSTTKTNDKKIDFRLHSHLTDKQSISHKRTAVA